VSQPSSAFEMDVGVENDLPENPGQKKKFRNKLCCK